MSAIAGLVLAGGLSTRMGRDKAFVEFNGRPMIAHAIERLRPRVHWLAISANGDPARFADFGLPVLPDEDATRPGPLAGVAAGLRHAASHGCDSLVTVPCDAPFAPRDLVDRLRAGHLAVAESPAGLEPLFALWPLSALADVEAALASGDASVWRLLDRLGATRVAIPEIDGEPWWLNLNSPDELAAAGARAP